jgi:hypothetical protein
VQNFVERPEVALWITMLRLEKEAVDHAKRVLKTNSRNGCVDLSEELKFDTAFQDACEQMQTILEATSCSLFENTSIRVTRVRLSKPTPAEENQDRLVLTKAMENLWKDATWKDAVNTYLASVNKALYVKFGATWTVVGFGKYGPHVLRASSRSGIQRIHIDAQRFFLSGQLQLPRIVY